MTPIVMELIEEAVNEGRLAALKSVTPAGQKNALGCTKQHLEVNNLYHIDYVLNTMKILTNTMLRKD